MADATILSGDIGVTWLTSNRQKRLEWIGGTETEYTMNEVYSAMQTLQDETTTIDDGTCFSAETPTEYTIGKIDQGDNDPWYIDYDLMEHINSGALKTSGWTRVQDVNTGIVAVKVTSNTMTSTDIGATVDNATDTGTLLEIIDNGTDVYFIIRPTNDTSTHNWDTASGTINSTASAGTATQDAVATTGDQIWANIYTIGTVEDSVHMYVYQGDALTTDARNRVYSVNSTTLDWYGNGHIDVTVPLKDYTAATWATIDAGYLNVYARKGGDLYASFEVANSITSGGRNPVPLQTSVDLDQGHGTKKISFTGAVTGTFTDGEIINDTTTLGRGILDLTNSTVTSSGELVYFPIATAAIGGALTAMATGNTVSGVASSASVTTNGNPLDDGPADTAWYTGTPGGFPTVAMAAATADIDANTTNEYYGVSIDCNGNPLTEVYQWVKYICQYGQGAGGTIETAESGVNGEEYVGATCSFTYSGGTTPASIVEGESVSQNLGGGNFAYGVVLSHDSTNFKVMLRSTRGSFVNTTAIAADDDSSTFGTPSNMSNFAAKTASPLGSFAGGTFFGARGVLLTDYASADANSFILTDLEGNTVQVPNSLEFKVTNLTGGTTKSITTDDRVSMFKLTGAGGDIDKDMFSGVTVSSAGDPTLDVGATIANVPDAGSLVIVKDPGQAITTEYRVRYSSFSGVQFTLANVTGTCDDTGTTTTDTNLNDDGQSFLTTAQRGDLVYTAKGIGYVAAVVSDSVLTLEGAGISGLVATDAFELNAVPVALDTNDEMYVPYIDKIATSTEEAASFIDPTTQIYYRVKVRNSRNATKIKPYSSDGNVTSADVSVQITRAEDTIIT